MEDAVERGVLRRERNRGLLERGDDFWNGERRLSARTQRATRGLEPGMSVAEYELSCRDALRALRGSPAPPA
jgi:hypothetical protein